MVIGWIVGVLVAYGIAALIVVAYLARVVLRCRDE